ncbi:hypothetical protein RA0C_1018 [Riemerella anatipestifer ATCC 11845 = DSM 15868]|uniref:Uncharacterized protein n=1 Tax=Riemerella anatipestifer (strain ATCC 11845 / DSM 15868 / JCM 9532 / NCTC 11014) TaxID=693978 RepID=H8MA08_RIEAD|nr:hypothetical protein RA0C_1018 [Riemerella anatipestifer ATCC 11845 = DSM 15868]AIH02735.1 hypothetical protein M949_1568 [Riemerella anatipestifer CH3]
MNDVDNLNERFILNKVLIKHKKTPMILLGVFSFILIKCSI